MNDVDSSLIYTRDGSIARIRFNRPEVLNAIDADVAQRFLAACRAVAEDEEVRVVVLSGAGRAFVSGGDLRLFRADPSAIAETLIDPLHEAILCLTQLRAPVIASLHGVVAGAGLSLAMACDLAIAADNTRLTLAYSNVGTSCDVSASWSLPRMVGLRRSLEIALLNEVIEAPEALRLGLVNRVVPIAALDQETHAIARRLADGPPIALGNMKSLMRGSFSRDLRQQLDAERLSFGECTATEDFSEALSAFFEKRRANYRGR